MDNLKGLERGGVRLQSLLLDKRLVTELSSDFSLPDYQPEIKRLLGVRAVVTPADKYIGAGSGEFSGSVEYSILYSGNDGELYCSGQVSEYRFTVPLELPSDFEIAQGLICDVDTVAETPAARVTGPRRLCVKCRLRSRVRLFGTRWIEEMLIGAEDGELERLLGSFESMQTFSGSSDALHLGDEILNDGGEELRVISAEGQAYVNEAIAGSGCVNCRGEVVLKLLCARAETNGAMPFVQWRRIPFTGTVPTEGAEVNCMASARGTCTDVTVTVEDGRILCEVSLRLQSRAMRNVTVPYTKDVYLTGGEGEVRHAPLVYQTVGKCTGGNFSLNTTLSLEEAGLHRGQTVADLSLTPTVTNLENDGGRLVLHGKCRCLCLVRSEDEFSAQEFELPFRYVADGTAEPHADCDVDVTVISCRAREDGERMSVDAELSVSIVTRGEGSVEMLAEGVFKDGSKTEEEGYTVCFPSASDTLWSVGKRYCVPVARLSEGNPLSGSPVADAADSLVGMKYLLI